MSFKIGDQVQVKDSSPESDDWDHGTVVDVDRDGVYVKWAVAAESYWENIRDLILYVPEPAKVEE